MTKIEDEWEGELRFVPKGAYIVFHKDDVQAMFKHTLPGSTRKTMSKYSAGQIPGWPVDEVADAVREYDPERAWPRTKGTRTRDSLPDTKPKRKNQ